MDPSPRQLEPKQFEPHARRFADLARLILWIEALSLSFWPAATLLGAFVTLALFEVPEALPALLHLAYLVGFAGAFAVLVRNGMRRLQKPTAAAALRRLELDSGLAHRPFETLADRPAPDATPAGASLWRLHQRLRRRDVARLRLDPPRAVLPARDPRAIRVAVLLALVLALVMTGPRAGSLIVTAFDPGFAKSAAPIPLDAWIKPPAYTGLSPILLKPGAEKPVAVPVGSILEAHVTGGSRVPRLVFGDTRQDFAKAEGSGFVLTYNIVAAGDLAIRRGWSTLAHWPIEIVPDSPPSVAFATPPSAMSSGALKIDYTAADDYGVASVDLKIRPVPSNRHIVASPIAVQVGSGQNEKELHGTSFQDLTAHPWAGLATVARLVATDNAGQTSESDEVPIRLPERHFDHPVARDIIDARKELILDETPRRDVVMRIASIAYRPETYGDNLSVFLSLRTAAAELRDHGTNDEYLADIEDLMWNAALKIEDGDRPEAEKDLRAAEESLAKALKDPSTPAAEIARLTKQLKDAIDKEMQALAQNMKDRQDRGEDMKNFQADPNAQTMDKKDLTEQLDKMQQMAQQGSRQAAEDMLNYIKSLLENLKAGMKSPDHNEQGEKALSDLKDLAQKQRELMNGDQGDKKAAEQQESLRQSLGDSMRNLNSAMGQIPQALGGADRAMRDATRSLQRGTRGGARQSQEEAAGQLDQAVNTLSDQLSDQSESEKKGEGRGDRDPFGRARFDPGKSVRVPTERELQRSREILDELRRRDSEHDRPKYELEYIERLLKQF